MSRFHGALSLLKEFAAKHEGRRLTKAHSVHSAHMGPTNPNGASLLGAPTKRASESGLMEVSEHENGPRRRRFELWGFWPRSGADLEGLGEMIVARFPDHAKR